MDGTNGTSRRDIPTRTRRKISLRCPDPVEKLIPGVLLDFFRITTLLIITADNIYIKIKALADFEKNIIEKKFKKIIKNKKKTKIKTENNNKKNQYIYFDNICRYN